MRWKARPAPEPKDGDARVVRRYAGRPTRVGDMTVWLESYAVRERFFQPLNGAGRWDEDGRETLDYY